VWYVLCTDCLSSQEMPVRLTDWLRVPSADISRLRRMCHSWFCMNQSRHRRRTVRAGFSPHLLPVKRTLPGVAVGTVCRGKVSLSPDPSCPATVLSLQRGVLLADNKYINVYMYIGSTYSYICACTVTVYNDVLEYCDTRTLRQYDTATLQLYDNTRLQH